MPKLTTIAPTTRPTKRKERRPPDARRSVSSAITVETDESVVTGSIGAIIASGRARAAASPGRGAIVLTTSAVADERKSEMTARKE